MCNKTVGSIDGDGAYQETLRASIRGPSLRLVVKVMRRKEKREKREERERRKKPLFKRKKKKEKRAVTHVNRVSQQLTPFCLLRLVFSSSVVLNILQKSSFSDTNMLHSSQETPSYPLLCLTLKVINGFILFFQTNSFPPFSTSQRRSL